MSTFESPLHNGSDEAADPIVIAREVAKVLAAESAKVDEEGLFPEAGLAHLKRSGLNGAYDSRSVRRSRRELQDNDPSRANSCRIRLSTGMIWAMHCQQVATIVDLASEALKERVLPRVARGEMFIASVTSEKEKGGHLLSAMRPSSGTARRSLCCAMRPWLREALMETAISSPCAPTEDALPSEVILVFADRAQLAVDVRTGWDSLGVRGTHSVGMQLKGALLPDQVIGPSGEFKHLAVQTMIPVGHIAWASCWLGAARGPSIRCSKFGVIPICAKWLRYAVGPLRRKFGSHSVEARYCQRLPGLGRSRSMRSDLGQILTSSHVANAERESLV